MVKAATPYYCRRVLVSIENFEEDEFGGLGGG